MSNKNTLLALNDVLFDQLQRLNDPKLEGDNLELERRRIHPVVTKSYQPIKR